MVSPHNGQVKLTKKYEGANSSSISPDPPENFRFQLNFLTQGFSITLCCYNSKIFQKVECSMLNLEPFFPGTSSEAKLLGSNLGLSFLNLEARQAFTGLASLSWSGLVWSEEKHLTFCNRIFCDCEFGIFVFVCVYLSLYLSLCLSCCLFICICLYLLVSCRLFLN